MSAKQRVGHLMDRALGALRHPQAFQLHADLADDGNFDALRRQKYVLFVTFRRNGEAVPSPVWCGVDERGTVYVRTAADAAKVKRIQRDPRVLLAASTFRGKPIGRAIHGTARVLPTSAWPHAEQTLIEAYGRGRKVYQGVVGEAEGISTYIEIIPTRR